MKPVAWQWLETAHFRKKVPTHADAACWRPLFAAPPPAAVPPVPLTDDMVEKEFVRRGDDRGQGLHPYWKSAFIEGWNFARAIVEQP